MQDGPQFSTTLNDKRYYEWPLETEDGKNLSHIPSITTHIKNGIPKPQIVQWAVKRVAIKAIDRLSTLIRLKDRSHATH